MLFNSLLFIVIFLPVVFFVYFFLCRVGAQKVSHIWLAAASLFFYGYWRPIYLLLIGASIIFNFLIGVAIDRLYANEARHQLRKTIFLSGIVANLGLLGFFKYTNFFIENINGIFGTHIGYLKILLPLAISFFTFQQIAYLVDHYRGVAQERSFASYVLFVTFFPHLLAGPIVHHKEMMPQFSDITKKTMSFDNISKGLFIFFLGLAKKVVLADTFAIWANRGFGDPTALNLIDSWVTSLSYTFQLYFDFSGYTDMAIGAALLFNIYLPQNFNSPYKALNIQDFWRRWHMTLSRFMRDYIYIPLGGNQKGEWRTAYNLFIVFLLGGLWHGAAWTFVAWGVLHGVAIVVQRLWSNLRFPTPPPLVAWFLTFNFINITWVFFRAKTFSDAFTILRTMFSFSDTTSNFFVNPRAFLWLGLGLFLVLGVKNSTEYAKKFVPTVWYLVFTYLLFFVSFRAINNFSEFLYFNF